MPLAIKKRLRPVGALDDFGDGKIGYNPGDGNGVPHELAFGGFDRRTAITFSAGAARPLRDGSVGIENDVIGGAFRDLADVIFDSDTQ